MSDRSIDCLTVRELISSSEHLGVTTPEAVALQRLIERVDEWKEKVQTVLANDCIAQIRRLISAETLHQEKPVNAENPAPSDQSNLLSIQRSPELGIMNYIINADCYYSY